MIAEDFIKAIAVQAAWEVGHEHGLNAMLGVLFTIRNRAERHYAGSWLSAIGDFSLDGKLPDIRHPDFLQLAQHVDGIFQGWSPDTLTYGADGVSEITFDDAPICAKVGSLTFTREPN